MKFDYKKTVKYWVESSEYDMEVADSLFKTKKYPYALFMGHLAVEKILKAIYVKKQKKHAPFTHSLPLLAEKSGLETPEKIKLKLAEFMEFYFEARYPDEKREFYKKCTESFTKKKLKEIKEVYKWLKEKV